MKTDLKSLQEAMRQHPEGVADTHSSYGPEYVSALVLRLHQRMIEIHEAAKSLDGLLAGRPQMVTLEALLEAGKRLSRHGTAVQEEARRLDALAGVLAQEELDATMALVFQSYEELRG